MNALDVSDPRPGISLGKGPDDQGAERPNQEEPKQALRFVSGAIREVKENQLERTARMMVSRANATTEHRTY
jgi:hypothetical protein